MTPTALTAPPVSPWTPRVTVAALVERAGRFLMVEERVEGELRVNQPAGHLEDGESLLEAVVRETLEETGQLFRPEALVGVYRWRNPGGVTFLRFAFCGPVEEPAFPHALDPEIIRPLWLDRDALLSRRGQWRSPLVMDCVEDYLSGRRYPLGLLSDGARV